MNTCRRQQFLFRHPIELLQHLGPCFNGFTAPQQSKTGATIVNLNSQATLQQAQVFIKLAADIAQAFIILWLKYQLGSFRVFRYSGRIHRYSNFRSGIVSNFSQRYFPAQRIRQGLNDHDIDKLSYQ